MSHILFGQINMEIKFNKKKVSILLPTYNGSAYIRSAIKSVLLQSYLDWELLVLDDGSNDNTEIIVKEYTEDDSRIIFLKNNTNLGIQKTLNIGLKEAKGEYIARIDDDDEWLNNDKLLNQVEFLDNNKDHVMVGTGVVVVDDKNVEQYRYLLPIQNKEIRAKILAKNCFAHSSVMFRKDGALNVNGYDESNDTRHVEDYDLWLKLGTLGCLANLPSYSVKLTHREGSISSINKVEQFKKIIRIINKYKNLYPNYFKAMLRARARLIIYGFIIKSPIKFSLNKFIKYYKENW